MTLTIMEAHPGGNCSSFTLDAFDAAENSKMMRVDGLIVINAILATVMVGIVAYRPRYRHRDFIRFLFQGATTLFLPILSYVVSNGSDIASSLGTGGQQHSYNFSLLTEHRLETLQSSCYAWAHLGLILLWANLVQIIEINTCPIVAADDREGRSTGIPMLLLMQAIWTCYLAVYNAIQINYWKTYTFLSVFAILFTKLVLKFYAFRKARRSLTLGRNPRLIIGYMEQLKEASRHIGPMVELEHLPPPLIVMGEDGQPVEKHPRGYSIKQNGITIVNNNGLVTIDKIWQLDDVLLGSVPGIRDLCFSFALFKMLCCRYAGYTAIEAGMMKAHNFFWHVLLVDSDAERLFRVIEDELSFLHDYYYSALPISYSKSWLLILNILTSLLTIIYCLLLGLGIYKLVIVTSSIRDGQITCLVWCNNSVDASNVDFYNTVRIDIGNIYFDLVPVLLLTALVVVSEIKNFASYVCSNWTKVALICSYVVSWQQSSPKMQRWVSRLLRCRCKLMKHWENKMNQCSVLALHPRTPIALLMRLLRFPDHQKEKVKVLALVKVAILEALKSHTGAPQSNHDGDRFLWAYRAKGTADTILIWHIATSILEVRYPLSPDSSDNKIAASHLSRYCAYLVACHPGLLPDDDSWCRSMHKAVKKDSMRVLACSSGVDDYEQLVALLSDKSEHEVLKKGTRLGKQLAEDEEEEAAWRVLIGFWSTMILRVAPSGSLKEHAEAVARGGELVTLLWVLLMHTGSGPSDDAAAGV